MEFLWKISKIKIPQFLYCVWVTVWKLWKFSPTTPHCTNYGNALSHFSGKRIRESNVFTKEVTG